MADATQAVREALLGRYPILQLVTFEEGRIVRLLKAYEDRLVRDHKAPTISWSCVSGFDDESEESRTLDPVAAIRRVVESDGPGFFVLHDLSPHLEEKRVRRALREAYEELRGKDRYLVMTSPTTDLPADLEQDVHQIEVGLPDHDELVRLATSFRKMYQADHLGDEALDRVAFALKGLTGQAAGHSLHRVFRTRGLDEPAVLREIGRDKEAAVRRAGCIEFVPIQSNLAEIGGLENLKDWLRRRESLFGRDALSKGMPIPRGMLVMGMSGCGKSLAAKSVAALWNVPLYRLDMNLVNSGVFGTPEAAFARALSTVEALAPVVLWIDEIENGLGLDDGTGQQGNARVFSAFLTWMQEKPPLVFVAATANRINALPAEAIRKGRFDQVFFVDLPTQNERQEIFKIHLETAGADPGDFDLELLAIATRGWNGAEIEQAVSAARVDAFAESRPFTMADVTANTAATVPLSKTMHEQMKGIRNWAFGRATLASGEKYTETESVALG